METKKNIKQANPNGKRKKILIGVAGLGLIVLTGFGYWFFVERKKKEDNSEDFMKDITEEKTTSQSNPKQIYSNTNSPKSKPISQQTKTAFPLKVNSKGAEVKSLQEALINKYGKSILPKFGADGWFGKELSEALKSKGFPAIIYEATYNQITGKEEAPAPGNTPPPNGGLSPGMRENIDIAKFIWYYASVQKFQPMLDTLKRIKNVEHYSKVNELFKTLRLAGVHQTIVNAVLSTFSDATSKQFLSEVFRQIGLKYHDEKWNLSGSRQRSIYRNKNGRHV